jgi:thiol-disulfide isomerase/thioredoxin
MSPVGIGVVALVLAAGAAIGIWRQRAGGRLRDVSGAGASPAASAGASSGEVGVLDPATLAGLGVEPGERATLLQFSSSYCAPCRAVSRLGSEVAGEVPGVRHVEVDAEEHLDVVKALGIWQTPTLLVLDGAGRIVKRATGVPQKPHLIAAVTDGRIGG